MAQERIKFVEGAKGNGIPEDTANAIFDVMAKFAAMDSISPIVPPMRCSLISAWLKVHYPAEFWAACLTNEVLGNSKDRMEKVANYIQQARNDGIEITLA